MRGGKRTVKWLYPEFSRVFRETLCIHQRDSTEATDVGVMQKAPVVEIQAKCGIAELRACEPALVNEQSAGKARLYDETITGIEIDHDKFGAPPAAEDRGVAKPCAQRARRYFAQNVSLPNGDFRDLPSANRAVEVARDRLGLR
jgi:hypothetical protein